MKNLFIIIVFTLALVGIDFTMANAQDAEVTVSASVLGTIDVQNVSNVNFGDVARGSTPYLDPTGVASTQVGIGTGSAESIGHVTVGGSEGAEVTITWNAPDELTLDGDPTVETNEIMAFTLEVNGLDSDDQSNSTEINTGATPTLGSTGYFIWIGGDLTVGLEQTTGAYQTEEPVTITVNYN
ncbi:MAG: DUF4402 domain-containing protein [Balneolales bacterium]